MASVETTKRRIKMHGPRHPCMWHGCKAQGKFLMGRQVGFETQQGYACAYHDALIGQENLERAREQGQWNKWTQNSA